MSSDPTNQFGSNQLPVRKPDPLQPGQNRPDASSTYTRPLTSPQPSPTAVTQATPPTTPGPVSPLAATSIATEEKTTREKPLPEVNSKLAADLERFDAVAERLRGSLVPASEFSDRCQQAFDVANELFGHAPTWVCFYRELLGGKGMIHLIFTNNADLGAFLRTEQYHQVQLMLTALRSRDMPENDPNDPQRMITVRLPKSLHEAMCDEAGRLNISVNRLCISRMLQLLDPKMIPETTSKPRGRKPRTQQRTASQ